MRAGTEVRTTCAYCGVGCGVIATPDGKGGAAIKGDTDHPANRGRLCSKGLALGETLGLEGRLLSPRINGRDAGWDEALDLVAARFRKTIAEHGPDAVAFYVSGQLLSEDYYVANKLMKGFIGSANIDSNSRLCMASTVAGHRRAFGTDTVPGVYEDLEEADLVVLVGSNLAWCHPVLYQRIAAAKQARPAMRVVNIDPRRTATCDLADLHLAIDPGADVALFNRLLARIADAGALSAEFSAHVEGLEESLAAARADQGRTGLGEAEIATFLDLWIRTEKVVTVYSQGVNQSTSGTDKVNAILNCHLSTGRIGRPGMGPFSITGQPNAMGGREVGGLANMLACHLDIEDPAHRSLVRSFWDAPTMPEKPGLKAVEMFRAVAEGRIKALWIMGSNPAATLPDADAVRGAIAACDFVVVSDLFATTDTARLADVLLPAAGWGEKDGTVTNSDRTISRQRGFLPLPGSARPDWAILAEVGRRMGWKAAFDYASPAEIFLEYAALSGHAAAQGRDFDISALCGLDRSGYDALAPVRWPVTATRRGGRFFADGAFFTPAGKARMLPVTSRAASGHVDVEAPFVLNTGRIRDQWHTMTRSGRAPRLNRHLAEPFLEIHPDDADRLGIRAAHLVEVESRHGRAILRAMVTDRVSPGQVFAPMHWTAEHAPTGRIDALVAPFTDPISGQPESKACPVALRPYAATWFGFAVTTTGALPATDYVARARIAGGWRMELAGAEPPRDWEAFAREAFGLPDAEAVIVADAARGTARVALVRDGRVQAALFAGPGPVAVSREHVASQLEGARPEILSGRPNANRPDPGATLCSCFGIGVNTIAQAIASQGLLSVEAIGSALGAGTNCGSCRPELATLLMRCTPRIAAE
ncbi:nitrate reductase [Defluviimonas sp. WL0075]|uniref:Molybdopterin-dependent oxidoreductase n=1 Tax=Albidovulum sediminicola TaxID=2984331 RepID=A0ABT2Z615_9RHOB|nr:nitrate reductase [Defluviimonas sp. WL0075]MCV2866594.1 molybdopterin-dependent oxidoreductase [Defluviimonas sp. WL0075]